MNAQPAAITSPNASNLSIIEVETELGDIYRFPAMDKKELGNVVKRGSNNIPSHCSTLGLVNASFAVISIPFRIIKAIRVDGEDWYKRC